MPQWCRDGAWMYPHYIQAAQSAPALTTLGRALGALVRGARTAQGLALAGLGRRTGYSAMQVSRYERGLAPLTDIAVPRRFAEALEIAPQLLGLAPDDTGCG